MTELVDLSLCGICCFGAGGLLAGTIGLRASRRGSHGPVVPLIVAAVLLIALAAFLALTRRALLPTAPPLVLASLLLTLCSQRAASALARVTMCVCTPAFLWSALAIGCPMTAALMVVASTAPATHLEQTEPLPAVQWLPPVVQLPADTAVTDRGRDVFLWKALLKPNLEVADELQAAAEHELRVADLVGRVMLIAPADRSSNCHGWVFTGGPYLIPDWEVELILQDNDYHTTEAPAVGDLVVYRNERGTICHTATVWGLGEDARVLLESKWAWLGRYLHPPDASLYGSHWEYYHSSRRGHRLRHIRERDLDHTHDSRWPSGLHEER